MVYVVIPRSAKCTAIQYDGNNFFELQRYIGPQIEKANKTADRGMLLLDTPYGIQKVNVGDVVIHQNRYWRSISAESFTARYQIIR